MRKGVTIFLSRSSVSTRSFQPRAPRPRLAAGVELIGEYKDSGLKEPPYLAQRPDGQMVQLTRLAFLVAAAADGSADTPQIAERVAAELDRGVSAANVEFLVERKLRPAGIIAAEDAATAMPPPRADAPLALTLRRAVVPAGVVRALAIIFRPLFAPVVVGAVLAWLAAVDVWLFRRHGLARGIHELLARPTLFLLVLGLLLLSTVFHECGHAAACRYGGARPGAMGAGLYLVWPAFYTDVTDAYRLDRAGRVRTDLGGIYFNALFILATAATYFLTGFEPLLVVVALEHVTILQQLAPWVRLDGYYVLTDLTGVPDILTRVRPVLASLVPGREPDARVKELKPWVRAVVTVYVVTLVPALVFMYGLLVLRAPRFFAMAAHAAAAQLERAATAWHAHELAELALVAVQMLALLLPALAIALLLGLLALRLARIVVRPVRRRSLVRPMLAFAAGAAAAALALGWWPREHTAGGTRAAAAVVGAAAVRPHHVAATIRPARSARRTAVGGPDPQFVGPPERPPALVGLATRLRLPRVRTDPARTVTERRRPAPVSAPPVSEVTTLTQSSPPQTSTSSTTVPAATSTATTAETTTTTVPTTTEDTMTADTTTTTTTTATATPTTP